LFLIYKTKLLIHKTKKYLNKKKKTYRIIYKNWYKIKTTLSKKNLISFKFINVIIYKLLKSLKK